MEQIISIFQTIMHIGDHIGEYGTWTYGILSGIIFAETGFVIFPFLPGDTLLFTAGAYCASGQLNIVLLNALIIGSAIAGNTVNYWVGQYLVTKIDITSAKWIDQKALLRTHGFFEKHGGKTIILARFLPIVRSFAPFVAGISGMTFTKFQLFNVAGACLWSLSLTICGYFFGNLPGIRDNLDLIVVIGIGAAVVPLTIAGFFKIIKSIFNQKR
ncbi:VTT domain-containing protein [Polynucleobacter rarus]|uniref:VTT domain-containing protein n=1 Tax=Polynucleobacter rarus TaxID=556055 RepID=UPI001FE7B572|nr:VTT domain-containing protein [Polynucleobacter rarus]